MATTLWTNRGHFYCPHTRPILVDCNFIVDSTNGNGFGVRSLKGQGIQSLFMHTSATPGTNAAGYLNPNPPPGYILMQFSDNFQRYYGGFSGQVGPISGAATSVTANSVYIITSLGSTTQAQWAALGLPEGAIPNVGASFVAISSSAIPGGGTVGTQAFSGIDHIEVVGDPNQTIGLVPVGPSPNSGGWVLLACYFEGAITAPANNSTISLASYLGQSSVAVKGE